MAWDLNEDEVNGVTIATNVVLRGTYTNEGMARWWNHPRRELNGKTPREAVATDPEGVMRLALSGLGMVAT